jgi:hypothetical protein
MLIHFELILVQGERQKSSFSLLHADAQFSLQHLLKRLLFSIVFWAPLSKISWLYMHRFVSGSSIMIMIHWSSCLFLCHYHAGFFLLLWLHTIVLGWVVASSIGLFIQNCFGYSRSFVFPYVFHDFFYFCAEYYWNFDRDCVGTCWLLLVIWPFLQCLFYQSTSMEVVAIFWCLLWFFSSVVYSFH